MPIPTTSREYRIEKFDGFHNLAIREDSVRPPKGNEVLLKIHAVSLQFRDIVIATGHYAVGVKENLLPCSDCAGEIISVGEDVNKWKKGDRVCVNFTLDHTDGKPSLETVASALGGPQDGVLTEYRNFPAHSLVSIPEHLSYEEASTLPCAAMAAYSALSGPIPVKGGDYVLVQGTGGVSISGLQLAVASGASVIATSSSDAKLEIAKKLGAQHVINYVNTPNWDAEVTKITGGKGVDHIIEVGGPDSLSKSLKSVAYGGWIHNVGFLGGAGEAVNVGMEVMMRASQLRGIHPGSVAQFKDMNRLISVKQIHPIVDKVFAFEEAQKAYEYLASQKHVGKVVIKVSKD